MFLRLSLMPSFLRCFFELWLLPNLTFKAIQLSQFSYSYPGTQFLIQMHGDSQEKKKKKPFLSDIHLPERALTYLLCNHGLIQFQNIHIYTLPSLPSLPSARRISATCISSQETWFLHFYSWKLLEKISVGFMMEGMIRVSLNVYDFYMEYVSEKICWSQNIS